MVQLRGLAYNQKTGDLCVDTDLWTTQAKLTKKLGLGANVVNNRVRRYIKSGLLPDIYIKELDLRLIPNVNNINELGGFKK